MRQEERTCTRTASGSSGLLMVVWRSTLGARTAEGVLQEAPAEKLVAVEPSAKRRGVWVVHGRRELQPPLTNDLLEYGGKALMKSCKKDEPESPFMYT